MKTYKIFSEHNISEDSYELGMLEQVNYFEVNAEVKANNPKEAIELFFKDILFYSFNPEYADLGRDEEHYMDYCLQVDKENAEPSASDVALWELGETVLYYDDMLLQIYELTPVKIEL